MNFTEELRSAVRETYAVGGRQSSTSTHRFKKYMGLCAKYKCDRLARPGRTYCLDHSQRSGVGKEYARAYYKRNSERTCETIRRARLKRLFGITWEQYDQMLSSQGGVCALCGDPPKGKRLAVDHDHKTGKVRGLLCSFCNHRIIGKVEVFGREYWDKVKLYLFGES